MPCAFRCIRIQHLFLALPLWQVVTCSGFYLSVRLGIPHKSSWRAESKTWALPGETVLGSCCLLVCLEDLGSPAGGQKATRTPRKWWRLANNRFSYWRRFCFSNMLWSDLMPSSALYPAERKKFQPDVYVRDLCGYCGPQDSVQLLVFFS